MEWSWPITQEESGKEEKTRQWEVKGKAIKGTGMEQMGIDGE